MTTIEKLTKIHGRKITVTYGRKFEDGTTERKYMVHDQAGKIAGLGITTEKAAIVLLDILQRRGEI